MVPPTLTIIIPGQRPQQAPASTSTFGIASYSRRLPPARRPSPLTIFPVATPSSLSGVTQRSPILGGAHVPSRILQARVMAGQADQRAQQGWWSDDEGVARARVKGPRMPVSPVVADTARSVSIYSLDHSSYHAPTPQESPMEILSPVLCGQPGAGVELDRPAYQPRRDSLRHATYSVAQQPAESSSNLTLPLYRSSDSLNSHARLQPTHWTEPSHEAPTGPVRPTDGQAETSVNRLRRLYLCPSEAISPRSFLRRREAEPEFANEKRGMAQRTEESTRRQGGGDRRRMLLGTACGLLAVLLLADLIWLNVELVKQHPQW